MAALDTFKAVEQELNAIYLEREEVVRGLLVGLISKQNVLVLGAPGTAKSALANDLCQRIGGKFFSWLLSRTSTPEELLGPISLKALEHDSYRRNPAGKLPEADIVFLDECLKCNSAVLNILLPLINEHVFFNDGLPTSVPLRMLVAASNELPEDKQELGALWDRFLLRYQVGYLKDSRHLAAILLGQNGNGHKTLISQADLAQANSEYTVVDVAPVVEPILALRETLDRQHHIVVSDRRWKLSLDLVRAHAWLEGRQAATEEDLAILAPALWQEPEQILTVRKEILALANPYDQRAVELLDEAQELYLRACNADETQQSATGAEVNAKLKGIAKKLASEKQKAAKENKKTARIDEALTQVMTWNREVIERCLGILLEGVL